MSLVGIIVAVALTAAAVVLAIARIRSQRRLDKACKDFGRSQRRLSENLDTFGGVISEVASANAALVSELEQWAVAKCRVTWPLANPPCLYCGRTSQPAAWHVYERNPAPSDSHTFWRTLSAPAHQVNIWTSSFH